MFIRSKHDNRIVNIAKSDYPKKLDKDYGTHDVISFHIDFGYCKWDYTAEEHRNQEYEWIISQLDCRVNEENVTRPVITEYMKCPIADLCAYGIKDPSCIKGIKGNPMSLGNSCYEPIVLKDILLKNE